MDGGEITFKNSIITNNTGYDIINNYDNDAVRSLGNNYIGNIIGAFQVALQPSDISGQSPNLGTLANNGGPTNTLALLSGSPAIGAGSCVGAPTADQRGMPRPQNGTCDIGAYERGVPAAVTATGGTPQFTFITAAFDTPLTAKVTDSLGGALDGITVTFAGPPIGAGIASGGTAVSGVSGNASFSASANSYTGSYHVSATVASYSATFNLMNRPSISTKTLNLTVVGSGSDRVSINSSPVTYYQTGFSALTIPAGVSITLTPLPDTYSLFDVWSGGSCSGSGACNLTMSVNKDATATFKPAPVAIVATQKSFATLTAAYSDAGTVTNTEVRILGAQLDGAATLAKSIKLIGGYNSGYASKGGITILNGDQTIQGGDSTAEALVVKGKLIIKGGSLRVKGVAVR
jgi:hypothetical protein